MSAALQAAAHQPPAALASPPLSPPSARSYSSPHSSPNREAYHANQTATSPASPRSRRPVAQKTTTGHAAAPPPPLDMTSVRPSQTAIAVNQSPSAHPSPASERRSSLPPVAPPRTSSSSAAQQHAAARSRDSHHHPHHADLTGQAQPDSARRRSRADAHPHHPPDHRRPSHHADPRQAREPADAQPQARCEVTPNDAAAAAAAAAAAPPAFESVLPLQLPHRPAATSTPEADEAVILSIADAQERHDRNAAASYYDNRARQAEDEEGHGEAASPPPPIGTVAPVEERRGARSRHDHARTGHKATSKFGDFILGNTIGEGEFGKVKLGWKQDSSVQVAIKLIKRDTVGSHPSRLGKIRREVTILRGVQHPNIVRLIDMIETDRYIGIILEYASGGELFDYILNHRYLKDNAARRLFSQLVSGVGYLHKKGIVHRDLKLENLLLDRNRNIIITDFGFANTFDPLEELTEEEEVSLTDRDFVKKMGLDKMQRSGVRRGDLMQTSCGSPCYAAPELVVSDSLYTGRKVDVWSCGVILYAMLAGYLPFDDDPANPEGDNINLLYKYIVSTPLTFPEYVTPHARDLLRRILVPNPRKRADLFEVARHSWLSDYAHVVEFITSATTSPSEAQDASSTHPSLADAPPSVARSTSVRGGQKHRTPIQNPVGGLAKAYAKIDHDHGQQQHAHRTPKDTKRRTVQVEYVAPTTQTQRGSDPTSPRSRDAQSRGGGDHDDHDDAAAPKTTTTTRSSSSALDKPLPQDPPVAVEGYSRSARSRRPQSSYHSGGPTRYSRDMRAISENAHYFAPGSHGARPQTGGSMHSTASMGLSSRSNYGQLAPPTIADTNAQGRIQQPTNADDAAAAAKPGDDGRVPSKFVRLSGFYEGKAGEGRGHHKRSSTIGDFGSRLLGRNGSVFGAKGRKRLEQQQQPPADKAKKYPPVSMANAMPQGAAVGGGGGGEEPTTRPSVDSRASRRSVSAAVGRKRSSSLTGSQKSSEKKDRRRFSFLPASFSLKAIGLGREEADVPQVPEPHAPIDPPLHASHLIPREGVPSPDGARGSSPRVRTRRRSGDARNSSSNNNNNNNTSSGSSGGSSSPRPRPRPRPREAVNPSSRPHRREGSAHAVEGGGGGKEWGRPARRGPNPAPGGSHFNTASDSSLDMRRPPTEPQPASRRAGLVDADGQGGARRPVTGRANKALLQKNHKRFTDAYEQGDYHRGHEGSSGAAKRVMDFFRRRGKARGAGAGGGGDDDR